MAPDLHQFAEQVLDELMTSYPLKSRPALEWKNLRVTAGIAYYRANRIALSQLLLDAEDRLRATLVHEYAHLLAYQRHGPRAANHGPEWKQAMLDLGATPERTHCYAVERNQVRQRVTYQCSRCGAHLYRARRLPRLRRYVHADCGGGLRLISVQKTTNSELAP